MLDYNAIIDRIAIVRGVMTQEEFADFLGLSLAQVSRYFTGFYKKPRKFTEIAQLIEEKTKGKFTEKYILFGRGVDLELTENKATTFQRWNKLAQAVERDPSLLDLFEAIAEKSK